jgi:nucleotide-binding universal stress UspA family protein
VIEFPHILCPVDLSESSLPPLAHAAALARWYKSQLTVLHVVPTFDPMPVPSESFGGARLIYPVPREEVLSVLRRVVDTAGAGPIDTVLSAEPGDPAKVIVDQAVVIPADLVVMGTHGRGGLERFMVGSIAEKVLRRAPCPVLTVPPHATTTPPAEVRFKKILCAMDFSPAAQQGFGLALDLARQADGSVTVLHIIEWLTEEEPRTHAHFKVSEFREHLADDARERLHGLVADEPQTWTTIQEVVVLGRAHREILRVAAQAQADLIVMGAQGRGGLGLTLFGSTTQQVVRGASCPVLTVRALEAGRQA